MADTPSYLNWTQNFSDIAENPSEKVYFPWWFIGFLWLVMVVLSIETMVGNLMVLLAYRLDRQIQRHLSNRFIVSLAISDFIIGLEGFPLLTVYVVSGLTWPLGHLICQIWLCLDYTLCLVSILTVLLITVDRYCSVCYPALYIKWQSERKTHYLIGFSWIIPALFFGIMIFGWTSFTGEAVSDPTKCYAPFLNDPYVNMSMYIVYYWATLFAMLILYRGIHKTAKSLEKRGEQREKQSLALLMGQRCMAQVGVGLLIKSQVSQPETQIIEHEPHTCAVTGITWPADSGYGTTAQPTQNAVESTNKTPSPPRKNLKKAPLLLSQLNQASIGSLDPYDDISLMSGFCDMSTSSVLALKFESSYNAKSYLREKKWSSAKMTKIERTGSRDKKVQKRVLSNKKDPSDKKDTSTSKPLLHVKSTSLIGFTEEQLRTAVKGEMLGPTKEKVRAKKSDESFSGRSQSYHQKLSRSQSSSSSSSSDECAIVQEITRRATCRANMKLKEKEKQKNLQRHASKEKPEKGKLNLGNSLKLKKNSLEIPDSLSPQSSSKSKRDGSDASIVPPVHQPRRNALFSLLNSGWLLTRRRKKTRAEKRARKAFRTITFIVGFFALFWSPYYIVATVYGFCPPCVPTTIFIVSYYMCYLNSSGNPFAYALANRQFRVAFKRLLKRDFRHV